MPEVGKGEDAQLRDHHVAVQLGALGAGFLAFAQRRLNTNIYQQAGALLIGGLSAIAGPDGRLRAIQIDQIFLASGWSWRRRPAAIHAEIRHG